MNFWDFDVVKQIEEKKEQNQSCAQPFPAIRNNMGNFLRSNFYGLIFT
jgi:hypothetical protein